MRILYNWGIKIYGFAIFIFSFFNTKAKLWLNGRKNWKSKLKIEAKKGIWMHCSSSGEFEQGRPVLEALSQKYPNLPILLTFYSPSGYELRKNYSGATQILYLPLDTPDNAAYFLDFYEPKLAIFVKYDLWINFLEANHHRKIPTILIAAYMQPNSSFLKYEIYKNVLRNFDKIYVQRKDMLDLLPTAGVSKKRIILAGDPRLDRCWDISINGEPIPLIENWRQKEICFVAGSIWPADVEIMQKVIEKIGFSKVQWILVPHEIHSSHIQSIQKKFHNSLLYSNLNINPEEKSDILIFDTMGMLSRLYRYSDLVYIGGGFGSSIHNTLEPAAWGNRIYFGPKHKKFPEAQEMIEFQAALCIHTADDLVKDIENQLSNIQLCQENKLKSKKWMNQNRGATKIIIDDIVKNNFVK